MAELTITVPDAAIPRITTSFKRLLVEGDAVDLENPTPVEIRAKMKQICIDTLKSQLSRIENQIAREAFDFTDLDLT